MKKILYTATVASHICQFHLPYFKMFREMGYEVHVAARDNLAEKNGLSFKYVDKFFDVPFRRLPFSPKNLSAKRQLKKIIDAENYDIIVCNTPVGGIVTRDAAKAARKRGTKVYYIAHGFHFYKGAPKKNWILYYPIEKHYAKKCDGVITINEEDFLFASKKFKTPVYRIHGVGVDGERHRLPTAEEKEALRRELGVEDNFVCLCTGELNKNKNQSKLIKLVPKILERIPNFKLWLAGNGPLFEELRALADTLDVSESVEFLGYRTDIERFVRSADIVATASLREGVPFNVIEAQLAGIPVVASENRGHRELIKNGDTGLISDDRFFENILKLYDDSEFRVQISLQARKSALSYTALEVKRELFEILFGDNKVESNG